MRFNIRNFLGSKQEEPAVIPFMREKLFSAILASVGTIMVTFITINVDYLVKEIPRRLENLNNRLTVNEMQIKDLQKNSDRVLTILESHDDRLEKLEKHK